MVDLVATGSSSSSPPSSPSPPRPHIVTPLIADCSPPRARRTLRRPPSPPPPPPPPPSTVEPPSLPSRMIDINASPPSSPPSSPPTVSSPKLGSEVNPISSPNELIEGVTTSDSSEDELFIPPCSPSTVLSPPKMYFLTWYDHPCTQMPTVLADPIPHTVEDESVGLEDIELNDREENIST
ncbi:merozoite surface protein CMZ-8-like [Cynara cardunculus var. scolymus]|uniref:merozoite surface protein CMZ-8-like n=1 Tax=Cynara cardunculus var. scolymus TaxID=59895 RepID=UPI000D62D525|nr:merozoite surface protein CMZ-8-like [Cynara cardunculus var. scolymus]